MSLGESRGRAEGLYGYKDTQELNNSAQIKRVSLRVLVKVEGRERMATSMAK